jgi:hypothetical protein
MYWGNTKVTQNSGWENSKEQRDEMKDLILKY